MPHTTTAVNQNRPNTGLNVLTSQLLRLREQRAADAGHERARREDEQLRPPQVDADRLRRGLRVAHRAEHAAEPAAAQVAGEQQHTSATTSSKK